MKIKKALLIAVMGIVPYAIITILLQTSAAPFDDLLVAIQMHHAGTRTFAEALE